MPRSPRADEAGGLYHALNRANLGAKVFRKESAFERVLEEAPKCLRVDPRRLSSRHSGLTHLFCSLALAILSIAFASYAAAWAIRAPEFQLYYAWTAFLLFGSAILWIASSVANAKRSKRLAVVLFLVGLACFMLGLTVGIPV